MLTYQRNIDLYLIVIFCTLTILGCKKDSNQNADSQYDTAIVKQSKSTFQKARELQKSEQYDQAITEFKRCLEYQSEHKITRDSLSFYTINSILQLMNCYQACGKTIECVSCYREMYNRPTTPMIRKHFMRDVCAVYAYALYRNDDMQDAKDMILKALKMHYEKPTHEQLFRDYSFASAIFSCDPSRQDKTIHYGLIALKESEQCEHTSGAQWLITVLATSYDHQGEIKKAIALHERAIKVAKIKKDTLGTTHAYMALSTIYIEWNMPTYANDCASMAIGMIAHVNRYPDIVASAYISKATALKELSRFDSMYIYLNKAAFYCKDLPYNNGMSSIDFIKGATMVENCKGDSLKLGIRILQKIVKQNWPDNKINAYFLLAKCYIKMNDNKTGEEMLDSMYNMLHQSDIPYYINGAYLFALNHYIKQDDKDNIIRYSKALAQENEFTQDKHTASKLANLIVQINSEKKEQQLRNYKIEARNEKLRLKIYVSVSVIITLLLIPILLYRKKEYKMRTLLMSERLENLTEKMQSVMKQHQETKERLSTLMQNGSVNRNIQKLSADLIKEKGEAEFKLYFDKFNPSFSSELCKHIDKLGQREELICMLTALGQDNNQISDLLCIAYRSVIMAKYRMKQRLHLDTNENFDNFIKDIVNHC